MKNYAGIAISKPLDGVWKLIFVLAIACLSWEVHAACTFFDGFKDNNDGTVTDPRNGLIWKRCAEGFEWNGSACQGSKKEVDWFGAMQAAKQSRFLGKADWRIPSKAEFEAVLGKYDRCEDNSDNSGQYAASSSIAHAVNANKWAGYYWASTPYMGYRDRAWTVSFGNGYITNNERIYVDPQIRFVRAGQSLGEKAALEFNTEYEKIGQYKKIAAKDSIQTRDDERRASGSRERNANACSRLYIGKPVSYVLQGCAIYCSRNGVVTGIGRGVAGVKSSDDGVVREKDCAELN